MVANSDQLPQSPGNPNNNDKKYNKLKKGIGALVLGGLAILGYETVVKDHIGHDVDKIALDTVQDKLAEQKAESTRAERPANLNVSNATPDQFLNERYFTAQERLDWAYSVLNQASINPEFTGKTLLEEHYEKVRKRFNEQEAAGGYEYIKSFVPQSEQMSGDEIFTLFTTIQDIQQNSDLPENTRLKLSGAIFDDFTSTTFKGHQRLVEGGGSDVVLRGVNVSSVNGKTIESPVFHDGTLPNGYTAAGVPSKIVDGMISGLSSGTVTFQATFQFHGGKPVIVDIQNYSGGYGPLDASYIQSIPAN
ncbi:hypothetical protein [Mycobacterium sp. shizuoka-1]|uniref:hypothetical protein n=1 Tax=Mycobacterium sp. shizuoka-1 TaxID=2039281 RepID=UPI000C060963|nr:hypothetical protein [Mycobacterium sp. shizuoka-1]GAY14484.1 hypothetical protein MSZK_12100 [Mycobacterium sp. shizuoka-1]